MKLFILTSCIVFIFITKLFAFLEPVERDIQTYAVLGHEILNGKALYKDYFTQKPPLLFLTYALGEWVAGYGEPGIFFINLVSVLLGLYGVYTLTKTAGGNDQTALTSSALWSILCGDMLLQANQPNTELFINIAIIFIANGFLLLNNKSKKEDTKFLVITIALLCFTATAYKTIAIAIIAFISISYLFNNQTSKNNINEKLKNISKIIMLGAIFWASLFFYYYLSNSINEFYECMVEYNLYYSGRSIFNNILLSLQPSLAFPHFIYSLTPLLLIGIGYSIYSAIKLKQPLYLFWAIGTQISIALPGQFYPHYYQLWIPFIAVASSFGIQALYLSNSHKKATHSILIVALTLFAGRIIYAYQWSPEEWSKYKYASIKSNHQYGEVFVKTKEVGLQLKSLLREDEHMYAWSNEPGLYMWAEKTPAKGTTWVKILLNGPLASKYQQIAQNELKAIKPEVVVVNLTLASTKYTNNNVFRYITENYSPYVRNERFLIMARKGSRFLKMKKKVH